MAFPLYYAWVFNHTDSCTLTSMAKVFFNDCASRLSKLKSDFTLKHSKNIAFICMNIYNHGQIWTFYVKLSKKT